MISFQETLDDLYRNPRDRTRQAVRNPIDRKPKLYFTIGLQRSGKSTYCTRWAQRLEMPGDSRKKIEEKNARYRQS
jgi:hypothetical protein